MYNLTKKLVFLLWIPVLFLNTQCDEDNIILDDFPCDETVIIDQSLYNNLESDSFSIENAEIIDNCLSLRIGASGCDGSSWEFDLLDSGTVAESSPEQRFLKLQLINNEACLAVIGRTVSFNVSSLQIEGSNEIILHIEGFGASIAYNY